MKYKLHPTQPCDMFTLKSDGFRRPQLIESPGNHCDMSRLADMSILDGSCCETYNIRSYQFNSMFLNIAYVYTTNKKGKQRKAAHSSLTARITAE